MIGHANRTKPRDWHDSAVVDPGHRFGTRFYLFIDQP
jgi:hypothetical protein